MAESSKSEALIFHEVFHGGSKERFYVKPRDQTNIVVHVANTYGVSSWFTRVFLPQGYPESVSQDYLTYQIWDTAQAFCSTISGILATQEVLRGVGVGDVAATPLAATITWVLKDGCGHIGRILFAFTHGKYLDAYSKKWRMYADILNDAAMCIEIALPYFKIYSMFALCTSTVMKSIVGVAGGATRCAMTQHQAVMGNVADVSAKDAAQETAVNLLASLLSLLILTYIGSSLMIFVLMMVLHVTFNYFAVRAVCLRSLNEPRFLLLIDRYLRQEVVATPCAINSIEPIVFYQLGMCILDLKICGFKIKLGESIKDVYAGSPDSALLERLREIYSERPYVLVTNIKRRTLHMLIKQGAAVDDILCGYFHSVLLATVTCAINDEPLAICRLREPPPFAQVCATLQSVHWSRAEAHIPNCKFAYSPSADLLAYLDGVVAKEWPALRDGIQQTGWDMSKHLLVTDQWRISREKKTSQRHSSKGGEITPAATGGGASAAFYERPIDELGERLSSAREKRTTPGKGNQFDVYGLPTDSEKSRLVGYPLDIPLEAQGLKPKSE